MLHPTDNHLNVYRISTRNIKGFDCMHISSFLSSYQPANIQKGKSQFAQKSSMFASMGKDVFMPRFSGKVDERTINDRVSNIFENPDNLASMVEMMKLDVDSGNDTALIAKNKLYMKWQSAKVAAKEAADAQTSELCDKEAEFWNKVSLGVFNAPILVAQGIGGLHKIVGAEDHKRTLEAKIIDPFAEQHRKLPTSFLVLHGPPGTGKTFYANCIADHLGYDLVPVKLSEISVNAQGRGIFGETSARLAEIFAAAKKKGNVVLLFDEAERFSAPRTSNTENDASSNTAELLEKVDEIHKHNNEIENIGKRVLVIAALNHLKNVDTAVYRLKRACIMEIKPTERAEDKHAMIIHEINNEGYRFDNDVNLQHFANQITGSKVNLSGVDIQAILQDAHSYASWDNKRKYGRRTEPILISKANLDQALKEGIRVRSLVENQGQ